MKLYRKFLLCVFIHLIQGNYLKISGPLLVHGWSCNWFTCCCSRSSTTSAGEKLAEIILSNANGTGYKHERVYSLVTFTPDSGYSINVVKEIKQDGTKEESNDQSKDNNQDGTKEQSKDRSKDNNQDGTKEQSKDEYNIIWKTDKKEEYASKVTIEYYQAILTIYIGSGETNKIVFNKGDDGEWKQNKSESTHKSDTTNTSGTKGTGTGTTPTNQTAGGTTGTGASGDGTTSTPGTQ